METQCLGAVDGLQCCGKSSLLELTFPACSRDIQAPGSALGSWQAETGAAATQPWPKEAVEEEISATS